MDNIDSLHELIKSLQQQNELLISRMKSLETRVRMLEHGNLPRPPFPRPPFFSPPKLFPFDDLNKKI